MTQSRFRPALPYLALALLWIVVRIVPVTHCEFWAQWDIWQARKLHEVGFWTQKGAVTFPPAMFGHLPYVADITYTHHPYLGLWTYAALYALGGSTLCFAAILAIRMAAFLTGYTLLLRWFSPRTAWLASFLAGIAPIAIFGDAESNVFIVAASVFPFAIWSVVKAVDGKLSPFWPGLAVFAGGQISWLFLTIIPALLWFATGDESEWKLRMARLKQSSVVRAILIGTFLTALVFVIGFLAYEPSLADAFHYLRMQTGGAGAETTRGRLLLFVLLRNVFYIGLPLCFGALGSLFIPAHSGEPRKAMTAMYVFIAGFGAVEFVLLRFCFIEPSPYAYLVFPMAVLTGAFIERLKSRSLVWILVAVALLLAAFENIRGPKNSFTAAVKAVAIPLKQHTQEDEIVLTNLEGNRSPFQSWESGSQGGLSTLADRNVYFECTSLDQVRGYAGSLKRNFAKVVFAYSSEHPISPELLDSIRKQGTQIAVDTVVPGDQPTPPIARFRLWVWSITGRYAQRGTTAYAPPAATTIEWYRMKPGWSQSSPP